MVGCQWFRSHCVRSDEQKCAQFSDYYYYYLRLTRNAGKIEREYGRFANIFFFLFYQNRTRALSFFMRYLLSHVWEWRIEPTHNNIRLLIWLHWIRIFGRNDSSAVPIWLVRKRYIFFLPTERGQYHNHKQFQQIPISNWIPTILSAFFQFWGDKNENFYIFFSTSIELFFFFFFQKRNSISIPWNTCQRTSPYRRSFAPYVSGECKGVIISNE